MQESQEDLGIVDQGGEDAKRRTVQESVPWMRLKPAVIVHVLAAGFVRWDQIESSVSI